MTDDGPYGFMITKITRKRLTSMLAHYQTFKIQVWDFELCRYYSFQIYGELTLENIKSTALVVRYKKSQPIRSAAARKELLNKQFKATA